jgi:hypothetical protein
VIHQARGFVLNSETGESYVKVDRRADVSCGDLIDARPCVGWLVVVGIVLGRGEQSGLIQTRSATNADLAVEVLQILDPPTSPKALPSEHYRDGGEGGRTAQ